MSSIRRIAPRVCPDCGMKNTLFVDTDRRLTCRQCGYKAEKTQDAAADNTTLDTLTDENLDQYLDQFTATYSTPYTSDVNRWAKTTYYSAIDAVRQGDYDSARHDFQRTVDQQDDFIDAWLWLGRLALDPQERHRYYSHVLAQLPNNLEATRELMVLKGEITRADAQRSAANTEYPTTAEADAPVAAGTIEIRCENCRGTLEVDPEQEQVICQYCGYHQPVAGHDRGYGMQSMQMALIKERSKHVTWKVGEHLLHCDNCGAERLISGKMTTQCPFCGSNHVVETDALESFQQPDGIVPLKVTRTQAQDALQQSLDSLLEKVKGWFINNNVDRVQMTPVYLPFWFFDITAQITRTMRDRETKSAYSSFTPPQTIREQFMESEHNVPVAGIASPPRTLTNQLARYDLSGVKPYDAALLANASAELYTMDFMDASMEARSKFRRAMHQRHKKDTLTNKEITISSLVQHISFRLVMLPVWSATIFEEDADVRLALIHGQTGDVVLGKAKKPRD